MDMENIYMARDLLIYVGVTIICAWIASQSFKTLLYVAITKDRKFKSIRKRLFGDGDFPSTHTTVSVTGVIIIFPLLWDTVYNATSESEVYCAVSIAVLFVLWTAMTIRDALGIRMRVQEQARILKSFLTESPTVSDALQSFWEDLASQINLKAGHMPHEVIGGVILALIFGIGANSIRVGNYYLLLIDAIIAILYFIISYLALSKKEIFIKAMGIFKIKKKGKKNK